MEACDLLLRLMSPRCPSNCGTMVLFTHLKLAEPAEPRGEIVHSSAGCHVLCLISGRTKRNRELPAFLHLDSGQSDLVADGEAQRAGLGQDGVAWLPRPCASPASRSNVREEARSSLWERLTLCCTDACLALPSRPIMPMAYEAARKEMKGHGHRQTSAVQYPDMEGRNETGVLREPRCVNTKL
jgi:hypothetical protein